MEYVFTEPRQNEITARLGVLLLDQFFGWMRRPAQRGGIGRCTRQQQRRGEDGVAPGVGRCVRIPGSA